MSEVPYRSLSGSLLYAALLTRADIAYPTQVICKFNENPGRRHWKAGQRILKYLKSTRNHGIVYRKSGSPLPLTDSDSDWADNRETRKSQSGWIVRIANGAVDWSTKAQKSVALSSCEAEYVAASEAFREVLWMRQLLQELNVLSKSTAFIIRMDSTSAMALIRNPVVHQRTKHIDIKYHFIRNLVDSGVVDIMYVPTEDNVADLFTKAVSVATFLKLSKLLVKE
jgi:hypothetical protein